MRGASSLTLADDYTVELQRKQRLLPFDKAFRQFRYGEALDEALFCARYIVQPHFAPLLLHCCSTAY